MRLAALAAVLFLATPAHAAEPEASPAPAVAASSTSSAAASFDAERATEAWLAKIPPEKREKSDAYYEGGYWLTLWDFLFGAALALALLFSGLSARMRDVAAKARIARVPAYFAMYLLVTTVIGFPLAFYEGFVREHAYGLANQTFGPWLGDELKGLAVGLVLGGIAITVLYAIVKRLPRTWWIWGALFSVLFTAFGAMIAPVFIAPLFNTYTRLEDPAIRDPILRLARQDGLSASDVWVADESRQSTRVSANVSGFLGTERITLNDNLLHRASPAAIQAVMGHEIGHYVMHHVFKMLLFLVVEIVVVFAFLQRASAWAIERWGARWKVTGIADPAGLPLVMLLVSLAFFVLTPVNNSYIRTQESEADLFGLNTARQPDGMAEAAVDLAEYRKMSPGPLEEILFYDHPSGRARIEMAMRWKSEN